MGLRIVRGIIKAPIQQHPKLIRRRQHALRDVIDGVVHAEIELGLKHLHGVLLRAPP